MKPIAFTTIAILALTSCRTLHRVLHPKETNQSQRTPHTTPATAPALDVQRVEGSFRPPPAPNLPVKQGPAPLAYIVEYAAAIRIAEMESGITLTQAVASPRSIVSIDEATGIRVGQDVLVRGPLPSGHTYGIYIEQSGESVIRSERSRPVRVK